MLEHACERRLGAADLHAQGMRDRRRNELGIGDGRERHEERAVSELVGALLRDPDGKTRLAGAAGSGQRHQTRSFEQALSFSDLALAANERRRLRGEPRGRAI